MQLTMLTAEVFARTGNCKLFIRLTLSQLAHGRPLMQNSEKVNFFFNQVGPHGWG